jgi:hypothetical protein
LYYLFYRSPAPFDRLPVHDYVVTPIDADLPEQEQRRRLRTTNGSTIKLNHVVHHGALGHHVQNACAYRGRSRIGQVAAVDGASRIGMFSGGTLAEGWACYACDLMEQVGFLTPLESLAQQHTRVRLLARAVADLELHSGLRTLDDTAAFYRDQALMSAEAAESEAVKNSMFPGTAVMYWLGTRAIHELRRAAEAREGAAFSLGSFHDRLLSYGAIPVPLIARLMMVALLACTVLATACSPRPPGAAPSNDLLIVGYDREPDTLNRFSTHILEDIQTPVVEGLTITDEQMNIQPLLAREVPTLANGGVSLRADGGMDVTWRLRPGITWHDGKAFTSADVKFTVDAINDPAYNPESTDSTASVPSTRPMRSRPSSTTAKCMRLTRCSSFAGVYRVTCSRAATSIAPTITIARCWAPGRTKLPSGRRASTSFSSGSTATGEALRGSRSCSSSSSQTRTHASINSRPAKCTSSGRCRGTSTARLPACRASPCIAHRAMPTST